MFVSCTIKVLGQAQKIRPEPKSTVGGRLCLQKDQKPEKSECFHDLMI